MVDSIQNPNMHYNTTKDKIINVVAAPDSLPLAKARDLYNLHDARQLYKDEYVDVSKCKKEREFPRILIYTGLLTIGYAIYKCRKGILHLFKK